MMTHFKNYMAGIAVMALLFTSCSKDEDPAAVDEDPTKSSLSFGAILKDFAEDKAATKDHTDDLPECSDGVPTTVQVALKDADGNWVAGENGDDHEFIEIPVNPTPGDYDDDGVETWFTQESDELELDAGIYTIEYFAVLDSGGNTLWIAPRENDDYGNAAFQNFVDDALPVSVDLRNGVKKYADVEVLCYDEHFANDYGYMFFDFGDVDISTLCVFGNVCPNGDGRHAPAHFRFDVWMYSGDAANPRGTPLFNENDPYINNVGTYDNGDDYAEPLCVALPDYPGEDVYYGEISLIDDNGNLTLIRSGQFTEETVDALFDEATNTAEPYHFREDCDSRDTPPIFQDPEEDVMVYCSFLDSMNDSDIKGTTFLELDGNTLRVISSARNLESGDTYNYNLHGLENGSSTCPPSSADENGNGIIDFGEAEPYYGPVVMDFGNYPTGGSNVHGTIFYEQVFELSDEEVDALSGQGEIEDRSIVFSNDEMPVSCGTFMRSF